MTPTEKPRAAPGAACPFRARDMSEVCHGCALWTQVKGTSPQTAEPVDHWGCALAFLPLLLIENAAQQRAASVELNKLRNENAVAAQTVAGAVGAAVESFAAQAAAERQESARATQSFLSGMAGTLIAPRRTLRHDED
jgi:hypothetical protein